MQTSTIKSKVGTLADATDLIPDGARLALGGFAIYQHPMALVRELVRKRRKDLTIVGHVNGIEIDMLAGAGCLKEIETSYVGLEKYGLAMNFRRAVEQQKLSITDYSEVLSFDRFRATQDGLTFLQCDYLGGSDLISRNNRIKSFECPLTGKKLYAVPPADPDVVVIHAIAADELGNVLFPRRHMLPHSLDLTMALGCDTVIVTVDKIVPRSVIKRLSERNVLPAYKTSMIVEAPFGAHPCSNLGRYGGDDNHFREYVQSSASAELFTEYLNRYVFDLKDHSAYLDRIGAAHLASLNEIENV